MVANVFKFDETQAPSDEGAVERSETEGEKAIKIKFSLSLPQSFFCEKRQLPRQREPVFQQTFKSDKSRVLTL